MQIQINSDHNIQADERLAEYVRTTLQNKLNRFADHVTRIEVHLSDENGNTKHAGKDKRCMLEARPEGKAPVAITEFAETLGQAVSGAAEKMQRKLSSELGKMRDKNTRAESPDFAKLEEPDFIEPDEIV